MKDKIDFQKTFKAIRQLPLEVSFQQVEAWVRQQPEHRADLLSRIKWRFGRWFDN